MKINFDNFNRYENPEIILCYPNAYFDRGYGIVRNVVGAISNISDIEIIANFNATSTLSFRVRHISGIPNDVRTQYDTVYDMIHSKACMYVHLIGFFIVTSCDEGLDSDGTYKDIVATSCEYELSNKAIPFIPDGTYKFHSDVTTVDVGNMHTRYIAVGDVGEQIQYIVSESTDNCYKSSVVYGEKYIVTCGGVESSSAYFLCDKDMKILQKSSVFNPSELLVEIPPDCVYIVMNRGGELRIRTERDGILEMIMKQVPYWQASIMDIFVGGYIDRKVIDEYRTFKNVDEKKDILSFLLEDIEEAFECVFHFDITYRQISVYSYESVYDDISEYNGVIKPKICISSDGVIKSIKASEDANDLFTAIRVTSGDGLSISSVNPTGSGIIYNFESMLAYMSNDLRQRVVTWMLDVANADEDFYPKVQILYIHEQAKMDYEYQLNRKNLLLSLYKQVAGNIASTENANIVPDYNTVISNNGGSEITISSDIQEMLDEIDSLVDSVESDIDSINSAIITETQTIELHRQEIEDDYISVYSIENYFVDVDTETGVIDTHLYDELQRFIYEGVYTDNYVAVNDIMTQYEKLAQIKILYERAKSQLGRISKPRYSYEVDTENFIFEKEFYGVTSELEVGKVVWVDMTHDNTPSHGAFPLFLTSITVNYEDSKISLKFGDRIDRTDIKGLFDNVLGSVSSSANSIEYINDIISPIKNGELISMQNKIELSKNTSIGDSIKSGDGNVILDSAGLTNYGSTASSSTARITDGCVYLLDNKESPAAGVQDIAIGNTMLPDGEIGRGISVKGISSPRTNAIYIGEVVLSDGTHGTGININGHIILNGQDISSSVSVIPNDLIIVGDNIYLSNKGVPIGNGIAIPISGNVIPMKVTRAEYDQIVDKDDNTVYYVIEIDGRITQYVGSGEVTYGSATSGNVV